jgi:uncharacterized protein (DUF952 family)
LSPYVREKFVELRKSIAESEKKMKIYHIVTPEVWEKFKDEELYEAESLAMEGFIHCSFEGQLEGVLERYYQDAEKVLIMEIETNKLFSKMVSEPSTNDELYPHIYGKINKNAIVAVKEIERGFGGFSLI